MPNAQSTQHRAREQQQDPPGPHRGREAARRPPENQQAPKPGKSKKDKPKKPFHFKRSELNLDEYRRENLDRSPKELALRAHRALRKSRQFWLYVCLQLVAAAIGYGQVMLCIGILWMCYSNTGKRKAGEKSAYSLFNEGVEAIDGSTDMQMLDRELRRQLY